MTPLLQAKNLSVGYGTQVLLDRINACLYAGQLVCLMGPNGIGKSSLIRTLAGLQSPLSGEVEIRDGSLNREQAISVVLTDRVQHGSMTVEELVTLGRYPYLDWNIRLTTRDRKIIDDALDQCKITHLRNAKIARLSDGQMQMVMIARALTQDTPIILLDEPTAHLDLNNRLEIMKLLRSLTRSVDKSILISTHELDLALQTADRIWLTNGKTIMEGIPEDLVISGVFDEVFQFKGFDLRTGRVLHDSFQQNKILLTGEGHIFLWTKNALERAGYEVVEKQKTSGQSDFLEVQIEDDNPNTGWVIIKIDSSVRVESIQALLKSLEDN